ncbi:type II toxin-antitoxin system RelE/ParE family toxin [Methylorubrum rhodesianum]|uniref:Type II toxin-antitoxin system RelE/ParE family toxin n=1 Tax=Methylorubrum rhodesianum TaxID=29427 RepID=A0ABU9ZFK9_9HYPH
MTSLTSKDRREVIFVNQAAKAAYDDLPIAVREMADAFMTALQNGSRLPAGRYEGLSGTLSGVSEFRIPHDGDTYRCYQVVEYAEVIYVLDAGIKKSPRGGQMPNEDKERLEKRLALARRAYKAEEARIKSDFAARSVSRGEQAAPGPRRH